MQSDEKVNIEILLAKAGSHFKNKQFAEAQAVYFEALKLVGKDGNRQEKLAALEGLADSYFSCRSYIEARAVYQQLAAELIEEKDSGLLSKTLFRQARAADMLDDYETAAQLYEQAMTISQKVLSPGDPQLTELYDCYAGLLRKARKDPQKLAKIEQLAMTNRQHTIALAAKNQTNRTGGAARSSQKKTSGIVYTDEYAIPKSSFEKFQDLTKEKPRLALMLLFSPLAICGLLVVVAISLSVAGIEIGPQDKLPIGTLFKSSDGRMKLKFEPGKAWLECNGKKQEMRARVLNPWAQLFGLTGGGIMEQYWLETRNSELVTEDGAVFYNADSPWFSLEKAMRQYASAVRNYYKANKAWPESIEQLRGMIGVSALPPETDFELLLQIVEIPESFTPLSLFKQLEDVSDISWVNSLGRTSSRPGNKIKLILVLSNTPGEFFFIIPQNHNNKRLCSHGSSKAITLLSEGSLELVLTNSEPKESSIETAKKIAISDKNKDSVRKKYLHLLTAFIAFPLLLGFGAFALKPLREDPVHWKYRERRQGNASQGYLLFIFMVLAFTYFAYLIWIVYG